MVKPTKAEEARRYYLLDAIRGICILGMIVYHTLFDIVAFFGVNLSSAFMTAVDIVRDFGACCFIALSGICIHFGKKPFKRSIILFAASALVSIVTYIVLPSMPVIFGILNFMWLASVIIYPLKGFFDKMPAPLCSAVCFILFIVTFEVSDRYLGYYGFKIVPLPECLYGNYITALFGFPFLEFSSSDYFPLIPWIFMFFFGFFLWNVISRNKNVLRILSFRIRFFEKIGKYSLYIYIAHQPVVMGILLLIAYILSK